MANSEAFKMQSGSRSRSVAGGLHGFRVAVKMVVVLMMTMTTMMMMAMTPRMMI